MILVCDLRSFSLFVLELILVCCSLFTSFVVGVYVDLPLFSLLEFGVVFVYVLTIFV